MALSALKKPEERAVLDTTAPSTSRTYALDLDTGEIGGFVDGVAAIRQFVRKAIATARFRYPVYNGQYGSEIEALIGQDVPLPLLQTEIPRLIKEALIYDERIRDVRNFAITRDGDQLYVSFSVDTVDGAFTEEVTL